MREARVIRVDETGRREMVAMRWGWPDRASPAPANRPRHIHARAETIDQLRTFAPSFAGRRGILPVRTSNVIGIASGWSVLRACATRRVGEGMDLSPGIHL